MEKSRTLDGQITAEQRKIQDTIPEVAMTEAPL